jgi:hypothetical protein
MLYLETKFASLVSYGLTVGLLGERYRQVKRCRVDEGDFLRAESQTAALVFDISRQTAKARSREARRKSAGTDSGYGTWKRFAT